MLNPNEVTGYFFIPDLLKKYTPCPYFCKIISWIDGKLLIVCLPLLQLSCMCQMLLNMSTRTIVLPATMMSWSLLFSGFNITIIREIILLEAFENTKMCYPWLRMQLFGIINVQHTHTRTHARTHVRTHARTHARTRARVRARAQTHTQLLTVGRRRGPVNKSVNLYWW